MKSIIQQITGLKSKGRIGEMFDDRIPNEVIDKALTIIKQARGEIKKYMLYTDIQEVYDIDKKLFYRLVSQLHKNIDEIIGAGEGVCPDCGGLIKIRNPTGKCDHLHYLEYKETKT